MIGFPKFGFDVMSYGTRELIKKIERIEKIEEDDIKGGIEDEEDDDGEPLKRSRQTRYDTRTKAGPKRVVEWPDRDINGAGLVA